MNVLVIE